MRFARRYWLSSLTAALLAGLMMGQGCPPLGPTPQPVREIVRDGVGDDGQSRADPVLGLTVAAAPNEVTAGQPSRLTATVTGGKPPYRYAWTPIAGLDNPAIRNPLATPAATTDYTVNVTDAAGQSVSASITLSVASSPQPEDRPLGLVPLSPEEYNSIPLAAIPATGVLPDRADLSAEMPPPGHQGRQGSCTAWAVGYALKTYQEQVERRWGQNQLDHQFSPSYLYNQIKVGDCQAGSTIVSALNVLSNQGCAPLSLMPYDENDCSLDSTPAQKEAAAAYRIAYWRRINHLDLSEVKGHLASGQPIVAAILVYQSFDRLTAENPVYTTIEGRLRGRHAIVVVGYDNSANRFKLLNCWGTDWGQEGYCYISYDFWPQVVGESYVAVDQKAVTSLQASASATPREVAHGSAAQLAVGVTGGTAPYQYQWYPAESLSNPTVSNPAATPASTTTYTVTVIDSAGQRATSAVTVTVSAAALQVRASASPENIDAGQSTQLTATASGGVPPYTYAWSPGTGLSNPSLQSPLATPTESTTYRVFVTDSRGNTASAETGVRLNSVPPLEVSAGADQQVAVGEYLILQGSASGGTGSYSYMWSPATRLSSPNVPTPIVDTSAPFSQTYTLTVRSGALTRTARVTITVNAPANEDPFAHAGQDQTLTDFNCSGSETVMLNGGGSYDPDGSIVSYTWTENGNQLATGVSASVLLSVGTHTVRLKVCDNQGGEDTDTVTITINSPPRPNISSVSPNPITADAENAYQTLTINGSNFVNKPQAILTWTGQPGYNLPSDRISFLSSTRITISIKLGRTSDDWTVTLVNPDGQRSNTVPFTAVGPTPAITSVSPSPVPGKNAAQPFTIYGRNFVQGCNVTLRVPRAGAVFSNRAISSFSSTRIVINPNFTTQPDWWTVEVINPDGKSTGQWWFQVVAQ